MWDRVLSEIIGVPSQVEVAYDALMPRRVSNLLLVSSLYDYYTIMEDGRFSEMLYAEYLDLDLRFTPSVERVSTAEEALEKLRSEPFDLVISMAHVGDMNIVEFGKAVREINPSLPVVLLAGSSRELSVLPPIEKLPGIDSVFVWLGDVRLFLAIIKSIEDTLNAEHDSQVAGVRSIILVEDSVQFYSSYLPMLYTEVLNQTRTLTAESVNRARKIMRMRARPKVLLARSFEDGWQLYERHRGSLLGVILDAAFPRDGKADNSAGFEFARLVREQTPDLPILMQSDSQNAAQAAACDLEFLDKNSPTLLSDLRKFMQHHLGFGVFAFLHPDGTVLSRVSDLRTLEWATQAVPQEYIISNLVRNDFMAWLKARTEYELAEAVRAIIQDASDDPGRARDEILQTLRTFRQRAISGVVAEYSSQTFEGGSGFVRIGSGSLGGKGRGLAFLNSLVGKYRLEHRFEGVRIHVPATAVLATGVFEKFMASSGLLSFALGEANDDEITAAFVKAPLPSDVLEDLWNFIQWVRYPLAVRSSSLLEDASYQPFAGIYKTFMIPNNHEDPEVRLDELCRAIKMVYASTYHSDPKAYMESLPNRLEEEKMAVVIQQIVSQRHGRYLYPNFAGVGRSLNYYPMPGMTPEDGVVSVALGMGKMVVDGGRCVRFCPAYPRSPIQSFSPEEYLQNSQDTFLALDMSPTGGQEFAVNVSDGQEKPHEFACLQIRPLVMGSESQDIQIDQFSAENAICVSNKVLGNGFLKDVCDLVYVRRAGFERASTPRVAEEIGTLNGILRRQERPYLLIGPGRWGSADPWLGIPVKWAQIAGVRCIIETDFEDMQVDPSQGSHFFQNVMSFGIGYLTAHPEKNTSDLLDFEWLDRQPVESETSHLRHIRFQAPLYIALDGKKGFGLVMKPQQ
ncbi:MAG: phosphoenolpyruvate synthase [candidate division Zixibacteria bacterium]|nr:phosphoenolpyruvate synthase [candidate division Zixibacteria bacterium]